MEELIYDLYFHIVYEGNDFDPVNYQKTDLSFPPCFLSVSSFSLALPPNFPFPLCLPPWFYFLLLLILLAWHPCFPSVFYFPFLLLFLLFSSLLFLVFPPYFPLFLPLFPLAFPPWFPCCSLFFFLLFPFYLLGFVDFGLFSILLKLAFCWNILPSKFHPVYGTSSLFLYLKGLVLKGDFFFFTKNVKYKTWYLIKQPQL